jgi:acyl-CoA thioesterase YciA
VPNPTATTPDALDVLPTSDPAIRTIAMPADTNPHGDIFGGWLLCQMDLAGSTVATRRANGRVVTVAITAMAFHRPVLVGDEVSCFCNVEKIGNTSIAVKIESWARRGNGGRAIKVTEGLFTYVHVGADGHPQPIAQSAGAA